MAVMTAAVANGGRVLSPRLVRKIEWPRYLNRGPTLFQAEEIRQLDVDPKHLKIAQEGMRRVIIGDRGTARGLANIGFEVAGKTGSAQFELDKRTHAWFVAYAPYDNPRFAVAVLVTEGGSGSETAGPIAADILRAAMEKYQDDSTLDDRYALPEDQVSSSEDPEEASDAVTTNEPAEG